MGVLPWSPLAGGWLSGKYRKGEQAPTSQRAERMPARFDLSTPANQRKLEAADASRLLAEDAGLSLIHLALAFMLPHPAVTAPIIGPRTMDHLKSPARRGRGHAVERRARPDRRDRAAGHHDLRLRQGLRAAEPAGRPAASSPRRLTDAIPLVDKGIRSSP